jgi:hypothetical protein
MGLALGLNMRMVIGDTCVSKVGVVLHKTRLQV